MNRKIKVLSVAAAGCLFAAAGVTAAIADIPDSGVIYGCYKTTTPHALSVVD